MRARRARQGRVIALPLAVVSAFVVLALLAGVLPLDAMTNHLDVRLQAPSSAHWLGTDENGRDVLHRLILGARWSLAVALGAALIAVVLGGALGAVAAAIGGAADWIAGRVLDVSACVPPIFLAAGAAAVLEPSLATLVCILGLSSFAPVARLTRAEARRLMASDFVLAARASGAGPSHLVRHHLLPGLARPVGALLPVLVAGAVVGEAGLSFLGLGLPGPEPSWGQLLSLVRTYPEAWWLLVFPGGTLFCLLMALNLLAGRVASGGAAPPTRVRLAS